MELANANSEPFAKLIRFHNEFNQNIKITSTSLTHFSARQDAAEDARSAVSPQNSGEPWGKRAAWKDTKAAASNAVKFLSEMGIVRAASAFEDFLGGAKAEIDRMSGRQNSNKLSDVTSIEQDSLEPIDADSQSKSPLAALMSSLGVNSNSMTDLIQMAQFFDVARNCIVHRSNRANKQLAEMRASDDLTTAMSRLPRRVGKWLPSLPDVELGKVVEWLPRYAIMASDTYYRLALQLDKAVVIRLGEVGMVNMAAHWCLLAENLVHCPAKLDAQTMVRSQLAGRYRVRDVNMSEVIMALKSSGTWVKVRAAHQEKGIMRLSDARKPIIRSGRTLPAIRNRQKK